MNCRWLSRFEHSLNKGLYIKLHTYNYTFFFFFFYPSPTHFSSLFFFKNFQTSSSTSLFSFWYISEAYVTILQKQQYWKAEHDNLLEKKFPVPTRIIGRYRIGACIFFHRASASFRVWMNHVKSSHKFNDTISLIPLVFRPRKTILDEYRLIQKASLQLKMLIKSFIFATLYNYCLKNVPSWNHFSDGTGKFGCQHFHIELFHRQNSSKKQ